MGGTLSLVRRETTVVRVDWVGIGVGMTICTTVFLRLKTLPVFPDAELYKADELFSAGVAAIGVDPFPLSSWSKVYCAAKNIPAGVWSNLSIDVMHGHLGVEHKMLCLRSDRSIRSACGTIQMHPAGTRAIRIPPEEDATIAAREVLKQYAEIVRQRTEIVRTLDRFHHGALDRDGAISALIEIFPTIKQPKLQESSRQNRCQLRLATQRVIPTWYWMAAMAGVAARVFFSFEERTMPPVPEEYYAEWMDSGGGRRKASKNLSSMHRKTKQKCFSITTQAGAKIQPYFTVPSARATRICIIS